MITNDSDRKLLKIVGVVISIFSIIVMGKFKAEESTSFLGEQVNAFICIVSFILFWIGIWLIFRKN